MNKNISSIKISALLILAVFGFSGCSSAENADLSTVNKPLVNQIQNSSANKSAENPVKTESVGICTNKYFPVSDGGQWRYRVSAANKTDTYTYTVNHQSGADKFTQTQDISLGKETELKIDWLCFPEGLRTASYGQITGNPNVGMKFDSKGGSGITLPKDTDWQTGKKWTSEYDLGGTFEMKPIKGNVTGKATLNHEIISLDEKVKVSAGEFTAAKVKTTISLNVTFQNRQLPAENITMTNWYAPDVGLVKQEVTGTMGKMMMDYLGK